jgi:hypothetical protein
MRVNYLLLLHFINDFDGSCHDRNRSMGMSFGKRTSRARIKARTMLGRVMKKEKKRDGLI